MGNNSVAGWTRRQEVAPLWRYMLSALLIGMMAAAFAFRTSRAWAAGLRQEVEVANEATESVEAQEGLDEPDGPNQDTDLNEAQEGIDELEGQNNNSQLNEGQEGVDELEGQNGDSQENEGQEGTDEADGPNGDGEPAEVPPA